MKDAQLPNTSEPTASSPAEDNHMPVYVGDNLSLTSNGDPADEFDAVIIGADNEESGVSMQKILLGQSSSRPSWPRLMNSKQDELRWIRWS